MKIIKVIKTKPPWKPEGKPWTLYSAWCTVKDVGPGEFDAAVKAFKDVIRDGAEFTDCERKQDTGKDGQPITVFTVKAHGVGKPNWKSDKIVRTREEMASLVQWAAAQTDAVLATKDRSGPDWSNVFDRILSNATVCVKNND